MSNFEEAPLKCMLESNKQWASSADSELLSRNAKGQSPKVLWFGCADSRTPESVLCSTRPGDVFVHRNIANSYHETDASANAVIAYAVNHLGVEHIVVVGHYSCGGVAAALAAADGDPSTPSPADGVDETGDSTIANWLAPLVQRGKDQLAASPELDTKQAQRKLVDTHAVAQAKGIKGSPIIQRALKDRKKITVSAWVYDVATGRLTELASNI